MLPAKQLLYLDRCSQCHDAGEFVAAAVFVNDDDLVVEAANLLDDAVDGSHDAFSFLGSSWRSPHSGVIGGEIKKGPLPDEPTTGQGLRRKTIQLVLKPIFVLFQNMGNIDTMICSLHERQ